MSLYPDSPNPPNYAAGLMDFSPLGNLGNDFYKGADNQLGYDRARAFAGGLPRNPDGSLNYPAMMETMARFGDTSQIAPLSNIDLDRRLIDTAMREGGFGMPDAPGAAPAAAPAGASAAPGAGIPPTAGTAPSQRVLSPGAAQTQRVDVAAHGIPRAQPKNSVPGGDDGETSLISIVSQKLGNDEQAGPIALKIAEALKLDPNATNDPAKVANLGKYVDGYLTRNGIKTAQAAPASSAAPAAPAAPAPVATGAGDPLAGILPPGVTRENAGAYLEQLRRRAAAFALSPRTAAMAKQYEDRAKVIETALQPTGEQKNAFASGSASPLQYENAKVVAKVAAENNAQTPEQKLYKQAVDQGFQGTELDFQAYREQLKAGNFKVVGKDINGNDIHGFVNGKDQTVKEYQTQGSVRDAGTSSLTGEAYLATIDPGRANQIRAMADGRMAPPGGMALKSPQIQSLMRDVAQFEPGFDFTTWKARNDTRTDLAKGKMGQNVSSFNTAIAHLDSLSRAADGLGNSRFPLYNTVANMAANATGDDAVKRFNIAKTAVADELTRAFRGSGGNVHDLVQWEDAINAAGSPKQLHAAIQQAVELLKGRIDAVGDQYNRGMGKTTDPLTLLSPKAKASFERLSGGGAEDAAPTGVQEGATATNPETGERLQLKGGRWVSMKAAPK
jgi:hypothetical protein